MRHIVKNIIKTLTVLLIVLSVISCVKDNIHSYEKGQELLFDIAIKPNTKSSSAPTSSVIWAKTDEDKILWMEKEVLVKKDDGYYYSEKHPLWPKRGINISFIAASPKERFEVNSFDEGLSVKDYDYFENLELVYTKKTPLLNKENWQGPVQLIFEHALALVEFRLSAPGLPDGTIVVKKLMIKDISTKGNFFSEPEAHWITSSTRDLELFNGEKELESHSFYTLFKDYLIPQNRTLSVVLTCDIKSDGATLTDQNLHCSVNAVWNCGKYITYILKISPALNLSIDKE